MGSRRNEYKMLIEKYQAEIVSLEEAEEDLKRRIGVLEELVPQVLVWYMWKVSQSDKPLTGTEDEAQNKLLHLQTLLDELTQADIMLKEEESRMRKNIEELEAKIESYPAFEYVDQPEVTDKGKKEVTKKDEVKDSPIDTMDNEVRFNELLQNPETDWQATCKDLFMNISGLTKELQESNNKLKTKENYIKQLEKDYMEKEKIVSQKVDDLEKKQDDLFRESITKELDTIQEDDYEKEVISTVKEVIEDVKSIKDSLTEKAPEQTIAEETPTLTIEKIDEVDETGQKVDDLEKQQDDLFRVSVTKEQDEIKEDDYEKEVISTSKEVTEDVKSIKESLTKKVTEQTTAEETPPLTVEKIDEEDEEGQMVNDLEKQQDDLESVTKEQDMIAEDDYEKEVLPTDKEVTEGAPTENVPDEVSKAETPPLTVTKIDEVDEKASLPSSRKQSSLIPKLLSPEEIFPTETKKASVRSLSSPPQIFEPIESLQNTPEKITQDTTSTKEKLSMAPVETEQLKPTQEQETEDERSSVKEEREAKEKDQEIAQQDQIQRSDIPIDDQSSKSSAEVGFTEGGQKPPYVPTLDKSDIPDDERIPRDTDITSMSNQIEPTDTVLDQRNIPDESTPLEQRMADQIEPTDTLLDQRNIPDESTPLEQTMADQIEPTDTLLDQTNIPDESKPLEQKKSDQIEPTDTLLDRTNIPDESTPLEQKSNIVETENELPTRPDSDDKIIPSQKEMTDEEARPPSGEIIEAADDSKEDQTAITVPANDTTPRVSQGAAEATEALTITSEPFDIPTTGIPIEPTDSERGLLQQLTILKGKPSADSLAAKTLQGKCRVKDHLIKSMADQLRDLARKNVWSGSILMENMSADPVKTYDFDRTTLFQYLKGEEPKNFTVTLDSNESYSKNNPLDVKVLRQLDKDSLLIEWGPPPSQDVVGFQIFVNGVFMYWVYSAARNKALLHPLDLDNECDITVSPVNAEGDIVYTSSMKYTP